MGMPTLEIPVDSTGRECSPRTPQLSAFVPSALVDSTGRECSPRTPQLSAFVPSAQVRDVAWGEVVAQARQHTAWSHAALGTMSASEGSGRTSSTQFTPRLLQFVPGTCLV